MKSCEEMWEAGLNSALLLFLFLCMFNHKFCKNVLSPGCYFLCARLPLFYGMRGMYARHRQSKVEGEQPKDTALAAVLISWFAAQVIYRGWGLLQLPSWDGLARRNTQSCGNMTDVP